MHPGLENVHEPTVPEPWRDPELLPKRQTTFDTIAASTSVPWADPGAPAKTFTTHDMVTQRVTIQAPRNKIGDSQIYGGEEWLFDGKKWFPAKDWNE